MTMAKIVMKIRAEVPEDKFKSASAAVTEVVTAVLSVLISQYHDF